jgi:hypothetical protein
MATRPDIQFQYVCARDGNGDPIPDSPQGIPLLGDGDGMNFIPTGMKTGKNCPSSGLAGAGTIHRSPSPFPATPPLENYNVLAFQFGLIRNRPTKAQYIPRRVYKLRNPNLIHSSPSPQSPNRAAPLALLFVPPPPLLRATSPTSAVTSRPCALLPHPQTTAPCSRIALPYTQGVHHSKALQLKILEDKGTS